MKMVKSLLLGTMAGLVAGAAFAGEPSITAKAKQPCMSPTASYNPDGGATFARTDHATVQLAEGAGLIIAPEKPIKGMPAASAVPPTDTGQTHLAGAKPLDTGS